MADGTAVSYREIVDTAVDGCYVRAGQDIEKARRLFASMLASHGSLREAVAIVEFDRIAKVSDYIRRKPSSNTEGSGQNANGSDAQAGAAAPSVPQADDRGPSSRAVSNGQTAGASSSAPNSDGRVLNQRASNGQSSSDSPSLPPKPSKIVPMPNPAEREKIKALKSKSRRSAAQSHVNAVLYTFPDGRDIRTVSYRELFHYRDALGRGTFIASIIIRDYPQSDMNRLVAEFVPDTSLTTIMKQADKAVGNAFGT